MLASFQRFQDFCIYKSINTIHHKNGQKSQDYLQRHRKGLWQNPMSLHGINPKKLKMHRAHLSTIKAIFHRPVTSIGLNGRKLTAFPLRLEVRQGSPFFSLTLITVLETWARTLKQYGVPGGGGVQL